MKPGGLLRRFRVRKPKELVAATAKRGQRAGTVVAYACGVYFLAVAAAFLILRTLGDRWWPATLLLLGPRWVYAVPLPLLVAAVAFWRVRVAWPLLTAALIVVWLLTDLCLPWRVIGRGGQSGVHLKILTCNTHWLLNTEKLRDLINNTSPDIVALQEWRAGAELFTGPEWHFVIEGQLCLASRFPIHRFDDVAGDRWHKAGVCDFYELASPNGPVRFYNVHLSSPHNAIRSTLVREPAGSSEVEDNSIERSREADDLARLIKATPGAVFLAGDFNLPSDSTIYRRDFTAFHDAFTEAGFGLGSTYHSRWTATRIDHVLSTGDWRCVSCRVGPDIGSPHRPVIADLKFLP